MTFRCRGGATVHSGHPATHSGHPRTHTHRSSPRRRGSSNPGLSVSLRSGLRIPARARCRSLGRDDGGVCLFEAAVIPGHTPVIPGHTHTGHPREGGDPVIPVCPYRSGRGYWIPARARCRSLGRDDGGVCLRLTSTHTAVIPRHTPVIPGHTHTHTGHPRKGGDPVIPVCPYRSGRGYWIPARARCRSLGRDDDRAGFQGRRSRIGAQPSWTDRHA